jgi:hypothetical protein
LGDPKRNLELFDYVTRTYRIELLTGAEVPFVLVRASFDGGDSKTLRSKEKQLVNNMAPLSN